MKPFDFSTSSGNRMSLLLAGLAAFAPTFALGGTPAPAPAPEEKELTNSVEFTVGGFAVSGNDAGFQRRTGNNGDFYGGISDFQFEQAAYGGTFTADGHALFGLEDYEVNLKYEKDDLGFIRAGYKQYRTWYDGSGGLGPNEVAPGDASWIDPITEFDDELSLDRGEVWIEAGLRLENLPEITFGYTHRWRDGEKDSTMWDNGIPAYYNIDETRDEFTLDIAHTLGNTDLALGLNYEYASNDNSRHENENEIIHNDRYDYDLFGASMSSTTRFNERMMLGFGYMFTTMDTDIDDGSRFVDGFTGGHTYPDLAGGSEYQQNVINGNFWWNPNDCLVIVPSLRAEWQNNSGISSGLLDGTVNGVTTAASTYADRLFSNDTDIMETTEALEVRYTGLSDLLLYASAELMQNDEDLDLYNLRQNSANVSRKYWRAADIATNTEKYTLGANWYPIHGLSVSAQYYYKELDQDIRNQFTSNVTGDPNVDSELYNHAYDIDNANIRLTWRAMSNLTFITRYDFQQMDMKNRAFWNSATTQVTDSIQSADITQNILTESVTWSATERFYLQGSVHWINSQTDTPANESPNAVPADFIPDWENDYWSAAINAGYSIDSKTDLTATYSYYGASNYQGVTNGTGYGLNTREQCISLTLHRMVTSNMVWNMSYGFITSNTDGAPDQTDGYNDFDAHMVSTGLQVRF
jgi:hypothetical protein